MTGERHAGAPIELHQPSFPDEASTVMPAATAALTDASVEGIAESQEACEVNSPPESDRLITRIGLAALSFWCVTHQSIAWLTSVKEALPPPSGNTLRA